VPVLVGEDPLVRNLHVVNRLDIGMRGKRLEHCFRQERSEGKRPWGVLGADSLEPPVLQDEVGVLKVLSCVAGRWLRLHHLSLSVGIG